MTSIGTPKFFREMEHSATQVRVRELPAKGKLAKGLWMGELEYRRDQRQTCQVCWREVCRSPAKYSSSRRPGILAFFTSVVRVVVRRRFLAALTAWLG